MGGKRDKGVIIEYPPESICSQDEWKIIMDTVLLPELDNFDLKIKRQKRIIVRFVDRLYDRQKNMVSGGNIMTNTDDDDTEEWCRINYQTNDGTDKNIQTLAFVLMHELTESDFWAKTRSEDTEAKVSASDEENFFKSENQEYRNLLDEKIANRRAIRAIRRMWPNANFANPEDIYEEDK